jgi:tetratricopeptide (TPR) repeat protein
MQHLRTWLADLGLEQYADAFEGNAVDWDTLSELTDGNLKDLGVDKLGHRKKILKAGADAGLINETDKGHGNAYVRWPTPVALSLAEYDQEDHPGAKLWAACDAFEMLTRLLVIAFVGDQARPDGLDEKLRGRLARLIESPTLGAWYVMARELADEKGGDKKLSPAREYVEGPLRELFYGPENPGTDETSFLKLRNRLAHGGGITRREQSRLLDLWRERVSQALEELAWIAEWELLAKNEQGDWLKLEGANSGEDADVPTDIVEAEPDAVWLLTGSSLIPLWPLAAFGKPTIQSEGKEKTGSKESAQVYVRKEPVRLCYVPLGVEGMGHSESSPSALEAFESLFRPSDAEKQSGHKINDFMREIRKDAYQMVGRQPEVEHAMGMVRERVQGVLWISGQAGMGKSFLMAKLTVELMDEFAESGPLVLSYRMRAGDQDRCSRAALAQFVVERLEAANLLRDTVKDNPKENAEKRLEKCLGGLKEGKFVILVLDGLDEMGRRDAKFAEEIPLALRFPCVLWLCAGRPEPAIEEPMRRLGAEVVYQDGLPPMREEDVRGMILEKIGPLRMKLLKNEEEREDEVINPFVRLVMERAAGLPLYVKYVIGDVLGGKYRVLDGQEELPESLHAYHEELLRRLGVGDLQAVVTPLAATLATAYEPLSLDELFAVLLHRKLVAEDGGQELVERGLAAITSMITTAPDPKGEIGYRLFHQSLRDHILESLQMTHSVSTAREAFADLSDLGVFHPHLKNYLIRCGVRHLLEANREEEAEKLLLDLDHLHDMSEQGIEWPELYRYWEQLGGEERAMHYVEVVKGAATNELAEDKVENLQLALELLVNGNWLNAAFGVGQAVLDWALQKFGDNHLTTACIYDQLGDVRRLKGEQGALEDYEHALFIRRKLLGRDSLEVAQSLSKLSKMASSEIMAIELEKKALEIKSKRLGEDHPEIMNNLLYLGDRYRAYMRSMEREIRHGERKASAGMREVYEEIKEDSYFLAFDYLEQAIRIGEASLGSKHLKLADAHAAIGKSYLTIYEEKTRLKLVEDSESKEKLDGETCHPFVSSAIDHFRRGVEITKENLGGKHPWYVKSLYNLGKAFQKAKDFENAIDCMEEAASAVESSIGKCMMLLDISFSRRCCVEGRDPLLPMHVQESIASKDGNLSEADKIRNYILKELEPDQQIRRYEEFWKPLEEAFGKEAYDTHFDWFMRHYLTLKTGYPPRLEELHEAFNVYVLNSQANEFDDIRLEAVFSDVLGAVSDFCTMALDRETDTQLSKAFKNLRELKCEVAYPLLLEMYADYRGSLLSVEEFEESVRMVESYSFRRAICSLPTNSMNSTFATFAKSIDKDRYLESIKSHFLLLPNYRRFPSNEEFHRDLQRRDLYNFRSRTYWLRRFEEHGSKKPVEVQQCTIERIMPQNEDLNEEWRRELGENWKEIQKKWLNTLGNLTLTRYDSQHSDRTFREKRDMKGGFAESPLKLNKDFEQVGSWNENAIRKRANRLADEALRIWPAPELSPEILEELKRDPS